SRIGHCSVADARKLDAEAVFKSFGKRDEVVGIHLERIWMAGIADNLIQTVELSLHRAGPVPFGRLAEHDHWPPIGWIPLFHGFQNADDLIVVMTVGYRKHVPAVRCPLVDQAIAFELAVNDAAE